MMLSNIFIVASLVALGSTLPQAPAPAVDPASIPTALPVPAGTPPNFRLIEWHEEPAHAKDHWTTCWNEDLTPTPKAPTWQGDMQNCLNGYDRTDFDGQDCGGVGWFKAFHTYDNPQNCFDACKGCMEWFIDGNSTKGYCWTVHGGTPPNWSGGAPIGANKQTFCNMGYH
jgi:hypothetical protein